MVLKEYFNFEKNISNKLLSITSFEIQPNETAENFDYSIFDSFYILFNVGSILHTTFDEVSTFCPAKDGLLGYGKRPTFKFNKNNYYKFIVVNLKDDYNEEIFSKMVNAIDYPYNEIIKSKNFCFSFSLNIEIIELIENMYKLCGENISSCFQYLEIESSFLFFLSNVLKIILFEEHKFNAVTATINSKFYMVLRKVITLGQNFEENLTKYKLEKADFTKCYKKYYPKQDILP